MSTNSLTKDPPGVRFVAFGTPSRAVRLPSLSFGMSIERIYTMLINYLVKGNFSRPRMQRFVVIGMALCLCAFHANAQTAMISSGDFTVSPSQVTPGQQDVTIVIKS